MRAEGKLWGTGYGWDADPMIKNFNVKKDDNRKG